jgi:pimeloyl-ACP methyl ester carboxylesterase
VLVSGLAQVGARWRRVATLLEDEFTVVTVDNRECGGTGPCPDGFTVPDMGADVLAAMTRLGHERFFLGGISMGGMIAQEVMRQAPERVRAAVLFATGGGMGVHVQGDMTVLQPPGGAIDPSDPVARLEAARETWTRLSGPGFADAHPDVIDEEAQLSVDAATPLEGIMRQLQAIFAWNPGDELVGLAERVPLVIAHGDADPLVPYENGRILAERYGSELVTYPGSGHVLESERAEEVAALMRSHFSAVLASS